MKRLYLASLLAAACSGASAQTSVNIYALLDVNISQYSSGSRANVGDLHVVNDGTTNGLNGSRIGFRGTRELGDGLKAAFVLEQGIGVDTGNLLQGGRGYGRQAFAALSHTAAGEIRLGRQYVVSDSVVGQGNPFANALVNNPTTSVTNMGRNLPTFLNAPRADNVIQYNAPALGPVQLAVQAAPGEATADRFHGLRAVAIQGPLYVGATYEWNKSRTTGAKTNKSLSASANYDFGFVKVLAGIQRNSDLTTTSGNGAAVGVSNLTLAGPVTFTIKDIDGWTIGAEIPLGGAIVIGTNLVKVNYESASGTRSDLGKFALTMRYALAKDIFLYAGGSQATGGLKDYISQKRVLQAGVRMAF